MCVCVCVCVYEWWEDGEDLKHLFFLPVHDSVPYMLSKSGCAGEWGILESASLLGAIYSFCQGEVIFLLTYKLVHSLVWKYGFIGPRAAYAQILFSFSSKQRNNCGLHVVIVTSICQTGWWSVLIRLCCWRTLGWGGLYQSMLKKSWNECTHSLCGCLAATQCSLIHICVHLVKKLLCGFLLK